MLSVFESELHSRCLGSEDSANVKDFFSRVNLGTLNGVEILAVTILIRIEVC